MGLVTSDQVTEDLRRLGVDPGATVLTHIALSRLGTVIGGEHAVIDALLAALGPSGTLIMPAQSWQLCDPIVLDPTVSPEDRQLIRDHLPVYHPATSPTRTMGRVAELFRTFPGVLRSRHPHRSFAALGPHAAAIVAVHDLDSPNGERSPLKTMYDLDAYTLLLGVGHAKSTVLHLAEHRSGTLGATERNGAPLLVDNVRRWVEYDEIIVDDHDFDAMGLDFAHETGLERAGTVGQAEARLMPQRALVDYAAAWFSEHRNASAPKTEQSTKGRRP